MPRLIQTDEADAADRTVAFHLVGADGITPVNTEAGGQPQVSVDFGAWTNTGIGTLALIGNGRYSAVLATSIIGTAGVWIETRFKSATTAECPGESVYVVNYDPAESNAASASAIAAAVIAALNAGVITVTGPTGTVVTGAAAYCSRAQFCDRYDFRSIADLLSDDGVRLANRAAVESNAILLELLKEASGVLEAAVLKGGRYSPDTLAAIAAAGGNGKEFLAGLVAAVCLYDCFERRPGLSRELPEKAKRALETIQRIQEGEMIFTTAEAIAAGLPETKREFAVDVEQRQMLSETLQRGLGRRTNRIDPAN